jgi:acyl-CoA thioester hydrolase
MAENAHPLPPDAYPVHTVVPFRYGDTDRQGHINNVVFTTLLEAGRVTLFHDRLDLLEHAGRQLVIAQLAIDFRAEMHWPGEALVGTGIARLGRSSITLRQGIFQSGRCTATAESVMVSIDAGTRSPAPLPDAARALAEKLMLAPSAVAETG